MKAELLKGLTEEQIAKLKACKSNEEVLRIAKEEDIELTDEQLEAVSGGDCAAPPRVCPSCNSTNTGFVPRTDMVSEWECLDCGHRWIIED